MPPPDGSDEGSATRDAGPDAGEEGADPPAPERPLPRGCNPLVFGVVMATVQMAVILYFLYWR